MNIDSIRETIYDSKYCVTAYNVTHYLQFFRPLIDKYLSDDYQIYVSTDRYLPSYKRYWPDNRIHYVSESIIPDLPNNTKIVYFFHRNISIDVETQNDLISFIQNHPLIKYVFVGGIKKIKRHILYQITKYYLYFRSSTRGSYSFANKPIPYSVTADFCRRYNKRNERIMGSTRSITICDYFIFGNIYSEKYRIYSLNKRRTKSKQTVKDNVQFVYVKTPLGNIDNNVIEI